MKKIKRFLIKHGLMKPELIELTDAERKWYLLCEGAFNDFVGTVPQEGWISLVKRFFPYVYTVHPEEQYSVMRDKTFCLLLELLIKISRPQDLFFSLNEVHKASFGEGTFASYAPPRERAIAALCHHIALTSEYEEGILRFDVQRNRIIKEVQNE